MSPTTSSPNSTTSVPDRDLPQMSSTSATDDVRTVVLNQVSWGAVIAGSIMGLAVQVILNMVGLGIGLSTIDTMAGESPSASSLSLGAGLWWVISGIVAAGIGGYLAGRLSGKPSSSTTAYHGLISWALSTLVLVYLVSSAASSLVGGSLSTVSNAMSGAGNAIGSSVQTAVQTAAPSLNNMNDPMARIENQIRSTSGGQDPAALRDAAASSIRAALSGIPLSKLPPPIRPLKLLQKPRIFRSTRHARKLLSISSSTMTPWRRRSCRQSKPPMQQPRRYREGHFSVHSR